MFSRQCSAHDRQLLRLLLAARCDELERRLAPQARYVRVVVWCKSCRHQRDADLQSLADAGRGDVPLVKMKSAATAAGGL